MQDNLTIDINDVRQLIDLHNKTKGSKLKQGYKFFN